MIKASKVLIIAEAGVNHNGSIELAEQLISEAAVCGADIVKFQTWVTEELVVKSAPKAKYQLQNDGEGSQFEMLKRLELSFDDFIYLKRYAESKNIRFLSTPDDFKSLKFLSDQLNLDILKVGSGEITNIPFLKAIGKTGKDVILSTGMASIGEVEKAYYTLLENGAKSVALLHCTSNYPARFDSVNLKAMDTLKHAFQTTVGYSDHTMGTEIPVAAVALGAEIIEKHFTLDKNLSGPDHKASLDPFEFSLMVKQIRNVEAALSGDGRKIPHSSELETKKVVTKGIYLSKNLRAGDVLTEDKLALKRPAGEIDIRFFDLLKGKKLKFDLLKDHLLKWEDIQFE